MAQDASNSLLAVNLPEPGHAQGAADSFYDDWPEPGFAPKQAPPRDYVAATWLDALAAISDRRENPGSDQPRIASINSDDNGLYRMFVGVSP